MIKIILMMPDIVLKAKHENETGPKADFRLIGNNQLETVYDEATPEYLGSA